ALSSPPRDGLTRVAVGTRITPPPPHRSRRALLTHRAPPSGSGVEAEKRQRVKHLDWRKEAINDANEALPGEAGRLATPPDLHVPEPSLLVAEPRHARVIARDCVDRVLSGFNASSNARSLSCRSCRKSLASCSCSKPTMVSSAKRTTITSPVALVWRHLWTHKSYA